jgi:hypothetical protein
MTRPSLLMPWMLCAALGVSLYSVKHAVQGLEEDLVKVNRQIAADDEAVHILKADWSYLTQPYRIGDLASRNLSLHPLTAAQIGSIDQIQLKGDRPGDIDEGVKDVLKAMQVAATTGGGPRLVE